MAAHHLAHRRQIRRAAGCSGEDLADLAEVGGSEHGGGRDREELGIDAAVVLKPVDLPRWTQTASPDPTSTFSPSILEVVTPLSP